MFARFLAAEESNFSLFNFVSSQSEEVDKMKTFVDKVQKFKIFKILGYFYHTRIVSDCKILD